MRKNIWIVAALLAASCGVRLAYADLKPAMNPAPDPIKGEITIAQSGATSLSVRFRLHGVASRQTLRVRLEWKAPDVFFVTKKGVKSRLFAEGGKLPTKGDGTWHVGDAESSARCFCKDSGEKGCWHGNAEFTIAYDLPDGRTVRAGGTWTMSLVDADTGAILATATYDVK